MDRKATISEVVCGCCLTNIYYYYYPFSGCAVP